ncbi:TetR/AcrR family transcriptional regulator C-terminal domain-containing protein [Archangium violaceum]|uniref:TetR/AcrR family transcriptional regulator C-terminal domain-containing protein n=1 Tax=Archangium violaceum TaxID=83451 RepID=UPI0023B26447|nr:TetR/AcrR family transcriptional regulator C-terminal domain-containing protein [Archangium violaceum]
MHQRMARYLERANATGTLRMDDPEQTGMDFFCLCAGDHQLQAELGVFKQVSDEQLRARVAHAVRLFLLAYRP